MANLPFRAGQKAGAPLRTAFQSEINSPKSKSYYAPTFFNFVTRPYGSHSTTKMFPFESHMAPCGV